MAFGAVLCLVALVHHAIEIFVLDELIGPMAALLLDGLPALGLVYLGYWLAGSDLSPENRWRVFLWCLGGATLFVAVMGLSLLVRAFEGRGVVEPVFPLLIATQAGGIAGAIAGYQTVRARRETRQVRTVTEALKFVNSLIRHDLRNDLITIKGRAELLEMDAGSTDAPTDSKSASVISEKADEAITRIETTGTVTNTLIGDPHLERVDLASITADMATRLENSHDLSVTTDGPDRAFVTANAGLQSVVDNLLENAVEHNDTEEPEVHIDIEELTGTIRLRITDNGPGIPDEHKERIRNRSSGAAGSGGLTLVRTLVERYGGQVGIRDNDPRGSVFIVELPRADTQQQ